MQIAIDEGTPEGVEFGLPGCSGDTTSAGAPGGAGLPRMASEGPQPFHLAAALGSLATPQIGPIMALNRGNVSPAKMRSVNCEPNASKAGREV